MKLAVFSLVLASAAALLPPAQLPRASLPRRSWHVRARQRITASTAGVEAPSKAEAGALPLHPRVKMGSLENGLHYAVLPNSSPPGRFEVHLELFAGSANELDEQQGMAHILEHIAYMGSAKRDRLFGTGSQTNAYTDFHHTVFYAACPTYAQPGPLMGMAPARSSGKGPLGGILRGLRTRKGETEGEEGRVALLPLAMEAVMDVLEARIDKTRMEQERAAVLSEAQMVNTMEYRVECQILGSLHEENILSKRFPIGKEDLIRKWTVDDVQKYHSTHYRPDNAMLYVVGDVDVEEAEELIHSVFSHLEPSKEKSDALTLKAAQSKHFPPVVHDWTMSEIPPGIKLPDSLLNSAKIMPDPSVLTPKPRNVADRTKMFYHELLQGFSFHLFAKRPVEPVTTMAAFKRAILKRVAIAALQIRLNVNARSDPPFTYVEFNQLDSPREGSAVCSLDLMGEVSRWQEAITMVVCEIRRFATFGLSQGELDRYLVAMIADSAQNRAQGDRINNADQLQLLMESVACGHTFMDAEQSYRATEAVVRSITLDEINAMAHEICEHFLGLCEAGQEGTDSPAVLPASITACVPAAKAQVGTEIAPGVLVPSKEDVVRVLDEAARLELEQSEEVVVPNTLITRQQVQQLRAASPPHSVKAELPAEVEDSSGVEMRVYDNGLKVNYRRCDHESQSGLLRLHVPGGRWAELQHGVASVLVGAKTMQEGGAMLDFAREQVELFCIDRFVMVEIMATEERVTFDFTFPTTRPDGTLQHQESASGEDSVTGLEAVLQITRCLLDGYIWEEDAFKRACQGFNQAYEASSKSLEGAATEALASVLTGNDKRFLTAAPEDIKKLKLADVKKAMLSQLRPDNAEVSISGDFDQADLEKFLDDYLGTIPAQDALEAEAASEAPSLPFVQQEGEDGKGETIEVYLPDSEERAIAHVAGLAPNKWGYLPGGEKITARMAELYKKQEKRDVDPVTLQRWSHPLFCSTALAILQECINRRLFANVRETRRLTYDANVVLTNFDAIQGSIFLFSVTCSPDKVKAARDAVLETLNIMSEYYPLSDDNIQSGKRIILSRHFQEGRTNKYWVELMTGIQSAGVPKDVRCVTDVEEMISSVTLRDVKLLFEALRLTDRPVSVLAVSSPQK
eukprot:scaffold7344_cov242-Pinguiococcus_pyrenoidosus.AAC.2